jgi:hypothetical protein
MPASSASSKPIFKIIFSFHLKDNSELRKDLQSLCENLTNSKNTCTLYKFQSVVDKCIEDKKILHRDLILKCLETLTNLMPSK